MTPAELVKQLQGYYGTTDKDGEFRSAKYTEFEQPVIAAWVREEYRRYGAEHLDRVFDRVTLDVSKNYGKLPDKALMEDSASKIRPDKPIEYAKQIEAPADLATEQELYEFELAMKAVAARHGAPWYVGRDGKAKPMPTKPSPVDSSDQVGETPPQSRASQQDES